MSFVPLSGPATWLPRQPPRASEVEFTGRGRTLRLPVPSAIPVLTRAVRADNAHPTVGLLGGATLLAMQLVARGSARLDEAADSWRAGPLGTDDDARVRALAVARSHADASPEEAEDLVRELLDAVADAMLRRPGTLDRTPVAARRQVVRHPPVPPGSGPDPDADLPRQVRLAVRVEAPEEALVGGGVVVVLQAHDLDDETHFVDVERLFLDPPADHGFHPRARVAAGVALREAAEAWTPLDRLQRQQVPDRMVLDADELADLLEHGVEALDAVGVDVLWPRSLRADLVPQGRVDARLVGPRETPLQDSMFAPDALFGFDWRLALGGTPLSDEEMHALAEATTPVVRLRDHWWVVDPALARRARKRVRAGLDRAEREIGPGLALQAALTGQLDLDGRTVEVHPGATLERLRDRIVDAQVVAPLDDPPGLEAELRDYQRRGLTWLAELTGAGVGACLADDMGLGKTITLIALHLHRRDRRLLTGPTLVVAPASLLGTWESELRRFAPGVAVRRFHGAQRSLDDLSDGFVLTTYGTMRSDAGGAAALAAIGWDLVVADEAQHVKNPRSATARHLRALRSHCRVALTGTPVENHLVDLWAILDWATPGLLGSRAAFRKVWAAPIESGVDPAVARRFAQLVGPFLLRRRKTDPGIAPELPEKTETDHVVALSQEQVVLYETLVRESMRRIREADEHTRRGLVLALLTGLKQICNHPAHYLRQPHGRLRGRSGKLELLDELLGTILAEDGAVLVFTQYVEMARLLERHLTAAGVPTLFLHGGTPVRERERMVRDFQAGAAPVFLLSLKAGGTGLTLTRADHVVHVDRWWNPAVEDQATDRAHRIGQTRAVQVHRLLTEGTIEERIDRLLARKRSVAEAVLGGSDGALTELSDEELDDLVRLRRDA